VKFASFAKWLDQPGSDNVSPIREGGVTHDTDRGRVQPAPELAPLGVFIGRWITEGETVGSADAPAARIVASDVYQWVPGGRFVMHPAYGRIGLVPVGGLEVIGYDPSTGQFQTHFFDSEGNTARETLSYSDGVWTWQGSRVRCRGVFSDDGRTLAAEHERSDDGEHWRPSMTVVLRKID
jgi:hypothetical protein